MGALMVMMMDIDAVPSRSKPSSSSCAVVMEIFVEVVMESPRRQDSAVDLCMMDGFSFGSSLLYICLGGLLTTPYAFLVI